MNIKTLIAITGLVSSFGLVASAQIEEATEDGVLLVTCSEAASIRLDDQVLGTCIPNEQLRVAAAEGQHEVSAVNLAGVILRAETIAFIAGATSMFDVPPPGRFLKFEQGFLQDSETALQWTPTDNQADVAWEAATSYCAELDLAGTGWRLPSPNELADLLNQEALSFCKIDGQFQLSECKVWSNRKVGSTKAWSYNFMGGLLKQSPISEVAFTRAICVRPPA
jgi:hypothetical protein